MSEPTSGAGRFNGGPDDDQLDFNEREARKRNLETLTRSIGPTVLDALANPKVNEVMLNADGRIWVQEFGRGMYDTGQKLRAAAADKVLSVVASMLGTVITRERPIVEGELPLDGSRFEGLMAPVVAAPVFAIRRPAGTIFTLADFAAQGVLTDKDDPLNAKKRSHANFLALCEGKSHQAILELAIRMKKNIVIIGGTGSGKTTFANALIDAMTRLAADMRLIVIQDTLELQCRAPNAVLLRTSENVKMQHLLRATLRLRPDRIVVGEVRGGEILDLIKAWNTGHPGGLTTIHADSAADGLVRMEQMMQEAGVPPNPRLIASVAHVVLFIEEESAVVGGRKIREVALVTGYDAVKQQYQFHYV